MNETIFAVDASDRQRRHFLKPKEAFKYARDLSNNAISMKATITIAVLEIPAPLPCANPKELIATLNDHWPNYYDKDAGSVVQSVTLEEGVVAGAKTVNAWGDEPRDPMGRLIAPPPSMTPESFTTSAMNTVDHSGWVEIIVRRTTGEGQKTYVTGAVNLQNVSAIFVPYNAIIAGDSHTALLATTVDGSQHEIAYGPLPDMLAAAQAFMRTVRMINSRNPANHQPQGER